MNGRTPAPFVVAAFPVVVPVERGAVIDEPELPARPQEVRVARRAVDVHRERVERDDERRERAGDRRPRRAVEAQRAPAGARARRCSRRCRAAGRAPRGRARRARARREVHEHELRHGQPDRARELADDDLGDERARALAGAAQLRDVELAVVALDERRHRAALAQRRHVARREEVPQRSRGGSIGPVSGERRTSRQRRFCPAGSPASPDDARPLGDAAGVGCRLRCGPRLPAAHHDPQAAGVFSPGGIGGGAFAQGLPALGSLVAGLASAFDVTFYSLAPVDPRFTPAGYRLRAPSAAVDTVAGAGAGALRGVRWPEMTRRFVTDHLDARYDRMLSFWGYPVGAVAVGLSRTLRVPAAVMLLGAETADLPARRLRAPRPAGQPASGHRDLPPRRRAGGGLTLPARRARRARLRAARSRRSCRSVPKPDLFPFEPSSGSARARTPQLKILNVGNLTAVKDQATLLRAFALLRGRIDARLRIVGEGSLRGELEATIGALGIADAVEMTGAVPFATMPDHYRWADMFVLTSLSEGQNRSLTEAAMCGVLQVGTPVGHLADSRRGGGGPGAGRRSGQRRRPHRRDCRRRHRVEAPGERRLRLGRRARHDWTVDRMTEIVDRLGAR